jgi:5'(3')-deoxyribonucleotidase
VREYLIALDVDETVAQLHGPWVRWINTLAAQEGLPPIRLTDFTRWAIDELTPLGARVYDFLTPDIYLDGTVRPIPGARIAVEQLRHAVGPILWVTSCGADHDDAIYRAKSHWLLLHGFALSCEEVVSSRDKFTAVGDRADILVDDAYHNVVSFGPERAVLITRPWNADLPWRGLRVPEIAHLAPLVRTLFAA